MSIVVVGGGVIGMLTARELALAGQQVSVLEAGALGSEASWAGGGIVSPLYPWRYPPAVTRLATRAQLAYPALCEQLRSETGIDPEMTECGLLMLAPPDERDALVWARQFEREVKRVDATEIAAIFPGLAAGGRGLWMPTVANVRNPRLLQALAVSLRQLGVEVVEHCEIQRAQAQKGRIVSLQDQTGKVWYGEQMVLCAGAWSGRLLQSLGEEIAVEPVRGQMLLYRLPIGLVPCMVLQQGRYLIPRRDGHVLVGSTLEYVGFDKQTTQEAWRELRQSAEAILPALRDFTPIQHWAGLRPGSPNGIPYIGAIPGLTNAWVNAGHFRNGLVLAPASAKLLADVMLGRATEIDPMPYQLIV